MGCDIHLHTEVKIGGVWYHYGNPNMSRCYSVFTKMAGVREVEGVEPISMPRGLPADSSTLTCFASDDDGIDGHSHSWLSAEEICQLVEFVDTELKATGRLGVGWWSTDNFGYFFGNTWEEFWEYRDSPNADSGTPDGIEDVRFVFWFDN